MCFEIQKGMPGLKQVGIVAHNRLSENLMKHNYFPCRFTPLLWKHKTLPMNFTLVVDDLGIKHVKQEAAEHLLVTLRKQHEISTDWNGNNYLGLTLDWSCDSMPKHVTLSMPKIHSRRIA